MATLQELQSDLVKYRAARDKILMSQEYTVGQGGNARRNRRPDLEIVVAEIVRVENEITKLQAAGGRRVFNIVPGCR